MRGKPIFVFTDPGIDDSLALALAVRSARLEIAGACAVAGNVSAGMAAKNLSGVLSLFRASTKIFVGNRPPASSGFNATIAHGANGVGNVQLPRSSSRFQKASGIAKALKERGEPITVVSIGPLTELARLLRTNHDVRDVISRVVIMGGGFRRGNVTPFAEFNFYCDPAAAKFVLRSGVPIDLITLDITEQVRLGPTDLLRFRGSGYDGVSVIGQMLEYYFSFHEKIEGFRGCYLHDPLAIGALLWPDLFKFQNAYVDVDTGRDRTRAKTEVDFDVKSRAKAIVQVATQVDARSVKSRIMDTILVPQ